MTIEISDVVSELMLPPELETEELSVTQQLPQERFSLGLSPAQFAPEVR